VGDNLGSIVYQKQLSMAKLAEVRKSVANYVIQPVVRLLAITSISPNVITWFGFLLAIGAAALIVSERFLAAGFVVLIAGFFDILDGALARHTGQTTHFGAVLDSTLDRLAEVVLLLGILVLYAREQLFAQTLLVGVALAGSLLVSYIRARAETVGLQCEVGLFTRTERVVVLVLGLLLNQVVIALAIIVVFSFITIGQRLFYVWRQTRVS
jgi:CDP-diacylglycerol--glycerol-3-phosphate 3-phosphatidyltransferase